MAFHVLLPRLRAEMASSKVCAQCPVQFCGWFVYTCTSNSTIYCLVLVCWSKFLKNSLPTVFTQSWEVWFHLHQHARVLKYQLYTLIVYVKFSPIPTYLKLILKEMHESPMSPQMLEVQQFFNTRLWMTQQKHTKVPHWPLSLSHQHSLQLFYYTSGFKPAWPIAPSPFSLSGRLEYPY